MGNDGFKRGRECGLCGTSMMMGLAFVCSECGHAFNVPRCLTEEVRRLNSKGVHVRAVGCLRLYDTGFIKVSADHIPIMELFNYEHISPAKLGITDANESYFIPKTTLPTENQPERWEDWVKRNE